MKKYLSWLFIFGVLISGILASRTLFLHNFYFNMHDDLQMMRQLELEKCFKDMQIPCRWVPDMGYGFGFPLFNYYPQLPYLFGEVFRLFSLPFNDVAKLTFALGIIASGISMYFLSSEFFGKKGGLVSAIFYIWAPYRAVDVYVRGAMNESWAWIFFPLILLFIYKLISKRINVRHLILLAMSIAGLLLTHNLMVMIFLPVALLWAIFWLVKGKSLKPFFGLFLAGILALGLSSFFTLPAVFEQKYVHIDSLTSDYFRYEGHFTTINQLFLSRSWGDGPSIFGPYDNLAFPIGQVHWVLISIISLFLIVKIIKARKISNIDWVIIFGVAVGTVGAFMTHERSTFIWIWFPILKIVQFPWRFLTLNVFGYALAAGGIVYLIPKKIVYLTICLSSALVIFFNWNYFAPVHAGPLTDDMKFTGEAWRIQMQAGIRDYLPITAKDDPNEARKNLVDVVSGVGEISNENMGTDWASFSINLKKDLVVRINIFEFPGWQATVDGKNKEIYVDSKEEWGRMYINIPEGNHMVYLKLENTPLRTVANAISLTTIIGLTAFILWRRKQNI